MQIRLQPRRPLGMHAHMLLPAQRTQRPACHAQVYGRGRKALSPLHLPISPGTAPPPYDHTRFPPLPGSHLISAESHPSSRPISSRITPVFRQAAVSLAGGALQMPGCISNDLPPLPRLQVHAARGRSRRRGLTTSIAPPPTRQCLSGAGGASGAAAPLNTHAVDVL